MDPALVLGKASFLWSIKYFCVIELEASLKKRSLESSESKENADSSVILKLLKFLNHWSQRTSYKQGGINRNTHKDNSVLKAEGLSPKI